MQDNTIDWLDTFIGDPVEETKKPATAVAKKEVAKPKTVVPVTTTNPASKEFDIFAMEVEEDNGGEFIRDAIPEGDYYGKITKIDPGSHNERLNRVIGEIVFRLEGMDSGADIGVLKGKLLSKTIYLVKKDGTENKVSCKIFKNWMLTHGVTSKDTVKNAIGKTVGITVFTNDAGYNEITI